MKATQVRFHTQGGKWSTRTPTAQQSVQVHMIAIGLEPHDRPRRNQLLFSALPHYEAIGERGCRGVWCFTTSPGQFCGVAIAWRGEYGRRGRHSGHHPRA